MTIERLSLWAVDDDGQAYQVGSGPRLCAKTRAVVIARNPLEAVNVAGDEAFKIGVKNAASNEEPAEICIAGIIGDSWDGCDARSVQMFLRQNKGRPVNVTITSGGGLAWDGIAMHNALIDHDAKVTCTIQGIAGSAATMPAIAGHTRIYENAQFFVHRAAVLAMGNRDAMDEARDWLDTIDEAIARTYKAKTNKALDKIMDLMRGKAKSDGTMMSAKDACELKFCNEMLSVKPNAATNSMGTMMEPTAVLQAEETRRGNQMELIRAQRQRERREMFEVN